MSALTCMYCLLRVGRALTLCKIIWFNAHLALDVMICQWRYLVIVWPVAWRTCHTLPNQLHSEHRVCSCSVWCGLVSVLVALGNRLHSGTECVISCSVWCGSRSHCQTGFTVDIECVLSCLVRCQSRLCDCSMTVQYGLKLRWKFVVSCTTTISEVWHGHYTDLI